jgi:transcription antitermination factor NusG
MSVFTLDSADCALKRASNPPNSWFAIRVRSNFEKTAAAGLRDRGYEQFLPQYRACRKWSDRTKELELPLFPGYLFARFDPARVWPILNVPGVVHVVCAGNRPAPVDDGEIASVVAILSSGCPAGPWPYLREGEVVTITRGALSGLTGVLLQIKSQYRLVVSVSMLMRSVAVEVDRDWVSPNGVRPAGGHSQACQRWPA